MEPVLSIRNLSKSFSGVQALQDVSVDFYPGEVHAIMGENGAGKSTLMKVLFGIYKRDCGEIIYKGKPVQFKHTADALNQGIAMVQQELSTIMERSVAENIFLGREPVVKYLGVINKKKMYSDVRTIFKNMDISGIEPQTKMKNLDIAQMQLVDIAKASAYRSDVLILDEATSSLTEPEVERLFKIIQQFKKNGTAVLYITHKTDEVFKISDKVTVLRDGQLVMTETTGKMTEESLITAMVGREIQDIYPRMECEQGEILLEMKKFSRSGRQDNNNLYVRAGEILGIAGLVGAGRTEMVESLFGLRKDYKGEVYIRGQRKIIRKPSDAISSGIALITEDRKKTGLNLLGSVKDNISIITLKRLCFAGIVLKRKERQAAEEQIDALKIKTPSCRQLVSFLSGGNQQKVVIAKWLLLNSDVIIMDEPTRGVDVGAKREIYLLINELKAKGKGIIMISSELPELIGMCDRLAVMCSGKINGILEKNEITQEGVMAKAISIKEVQSNE